MAVELQPQGTDPPKPLTGRPAFVQLNKMNTIVIPHDPKDASSGKWFAVAAGPPRQPVPVARTGNEVVFLIDGGETYGQFEFEVQNTNGENDFIYLIGWYLDLDFKLPGGFTMRELLGAAMNRKVEIRVILANSPNFINNRPVVGWVNQSLKSSGAAVIDGRNLLEGTHHQKILIVKRGKQLTAFCGGLDINRDRLQPGDNGKNPQHDVHCRIRGPAAWDLLSIFCQRWADYMKNVYPSLPLPSESTIWVEENKKLQGRNISLPAGCGDLTVQIARTYGNAPTFSYDFAPKGERSVLNLITRAIKAAQRFIYIEDQYLVDMQVAELLKNQLSQIKHLTILIPPAKLSDLPQGIYRRNQFIRKLKEGGAADKVRVYCPAKPSPTCGLYVHAKTWIFDDKFAIIGSANCNRRGTTHDSEVVAGIFDASRDDKLTYCFAHRLRIKLWAHHLGLDDPNGHAELADGVASGDNWLPAFLPDNARIVAYYEEIEKGDLINTDTLWDHTYDPDGS
jgi:phosphatidylserine/phosphatidylglycerophosphate/cardiolipin synthase-like enzyme